MHSVHHMNIIWVAVTLSRVTRAFNLDTSKPIVLKGSPNSYFGFSLAMHSNIEGKWLLVGAPLANSSHQNLPSTGTLSKCNLPQGVCTEVLVDDKGNELSTSIELINTRLLERKQGMWLGGSMATNSNGAGTVVVCSPLWVAGLRDRKKDNDYFLNGMCYMMDGLLKDPRKLFPTSDYLEEINTNVDVDSYHFLFGMGNLGISAHITQNGEDIVLGAPGFFDGKGGLVHYDLSTLRHRMSEDESLDKKGTYTYIGYAVTSIRLYPDDTHYVVGAPRTGERGKIYIYRGKFEKEGEFSGDQMGSYFGGALCAVDLTGDGLEDLLVGAPLYKRALFEEGQVHVLINRRGGILQDINKPLIGSDKPGARFGSAISPVGDLNDDTFSDVVIGAPYEDDGLGAVYIYLGSRYGIQTTFAQRISPRDLGPDLSPAQSFGYSIAAGLDIDNNQYDDVSIGAYGSSQVVVLRALPVVKLKASLQIRGSPSNPRLGYSKDGSGNYRACAVVIVTMTYEGRAVPDTIDVNYTIKHDMRSSSPSLLDTCTYSSSALSTTRRIIAHIENRAEHSFLVQVRKLSIPVHFTLNFGLASVSQGKSVLDPALPRLIHGKMSFANDCELDVITGIHIKDTEFIILGAKTFVSPRIRVNNKGKLGCVAPNFVVTHPDQVNYVKVKSDDVSLGNTMACGPVALGNAVECEMVHLMPANSTVDFIMTFDPQYATEVKDSMEFELTVGSKTFQAQVRVQRSSSLTITGATYPADVFIMADDTSLLTSSLSHNYTIINQGPGLAQITKIILALPETTAEGEPIFTNFTIEPLGGSRATVGGCQNAQEEHPQLNSTITDDPLAANTSQKMTKSYTLDCSVAHCIIKECSIANFPPTENMIMTLQFYVNLTTVRSLRYPLVKVKSVAILQEEDEAGQIKETLEEVVTRIFSRSTPPTRPVPWWVILVGVVSGVGLLIALVAILKKCGFFRRPQKEEMDQFVGEVDDTVENGMS